MTRTPWQRAPGYDDEERHDYLDQKPLPRQRYELDDPDGPTNQDKATP